MSVPASIAAVLMIAFLTSSTFADRKTAAVRAIPGQGLAPVDTDAPVAVGAWGDSVCALGLGEHATGGSPKTAKFDKNLNPICTGTVTTQGLLSAGHCWEYFKDLASKLPAGKRAVLGLCCGKLDCTESKNFDILESAEFLGAEAAHGKNTAYGLKPFDQGFFTLPERYRSRAISLPSSRSEADRLVASSGCVLAGYGYRDGEESVKGELVAGPVKRTPTFEASKLDNSPIRCFATEAEAREFYFYPSEQTRIRRVDSGGPTICEDPRKRGAFYVVASSVGGCGGNSMRYDWTMTLPIFADKKFDNIKKVEWVQPSVSPNGSAAPVTSIGGD